MNETETWYERNQAHNAVTSWLHSLRYKRAIETVLEVGRTLTRPVRVLDIGCGYGKLFDVLDPLLPIEYTGIEIDRDFATIARERHSNDNFTLVQESALTALGRCQPADVVTALETFEHIPEGDVVRLIEQIAAMRPAKLFASVPVEIGPAIWLKNVGSLVCGYVRHREYTWTETLWAGLYQLDRLPPHGTLHKGFDWRWLAQTIRQNMRIIQLVKSPCRWLPAASVCFIAEPR